MASKWETETASDVCAWIQRATGVSVPSDDPSDFAEALKNGQTLCQLANMIQPGSIKKINKMKTPFMMMENIGWFSDFVTAFGVQREYGFVTVDLYEKRNVYQVLLALKWLKVEMENIGWFSDFVTAFGVQREYGFVTVDLYEKRNVYQVLLALKWLKVEAEKKNIKL